MSIVVVVVIEKDGKYLLVEEREGFWALPGGKAKKGENLIEAARREVMEETGYDVEIVGVIRVYQQVNHPEAPVIFAFKGEIKKGEGRGVLNAKWLTENEISEKAGYPETRQLIKERKPRKIRSFNGLKIFI